MATTDKEALLDELRHLVKTITPIPDEPDFLTSEETLLRYLKGCEWNVTEAERNLAATVEYRKTRNPLQSDCPWCHRRPGFHSMRQVGFDELGRPVLYSCFAQAATHKNRVEDAVDHVTYLIENAKMTMKPGISTWVFIIDCTGLSLPACNPKLGYGVTQTLSAHYPERLGMVICINHNPIFQGIWKAIKVFLHPNTVSKMKLLRSKDKIHQTFQKFFSEELTDWLLEEIKLNRRQPLPKSQKEFWAKPSDAASAHDPRGTASYVRDFVDTYPTTHSKDTTLSPKCLRHKPHPNIIDSIQGTLQEVTMSPEEENEREAARTVAGAASAQSNDDSDREDVPGIDIDEALQIPSNAIHLNT